MSQSADHRRRSTPRTRPGASAPRTLIETLEPRQLLAGHCLAVASGLPVAAALPSILYQTSRSTAGANRTASGSTTVAIAPAIQAADDSAPVQRLGSGSHFSGYNYIPPDGSAPPPVVVVVELSNGQLTEVSSSGGALIATTTKPKKFKPSDIVLAGTPDAGPALTPLAQTPAGPAPIKSMSGGAERLEVPPVLPPPATSVAPDAPIKIAPPHTAMYLGGVAMADPAEVVLAAAPTSVVGIADGLSYATNKAADALALVASPDGSSAAATYNFVHFNPANLLNDAIGAFSLDSATLSLVPAPIHSTAHAWSVTIAVIGVDLFLIGYCYQRSRRQKAAAAKFAGNLIARP